MKIIYESLRKGRIIGLFGRAGSGKTSLANRLSESLSNVMVYSGDYRFKLSSYERKNLLLDYDMFNYLKNINQFNWWDFKKIFSDIKEFKKNGEVKLESYYDRQTGEFKEDLILKGDVLIFENCIATEEILNLCDSIFFIDVPIKECFDSIYKKDKGRRTFLDIIERFMITNKSEGDFIKVLLDRENVTFINREGDPIIPLKQEFSDKIPVSYNRSYSASKSYDGTAFVDLDGTLIEHNEIPKTKGNKLLADALKSLKLLRDKNYQIILTTSRDRENFYALSKDLIKLGLEWDDAVTNITHNNRILINDSKEGADRAHAISIKRDESFYDSLRKILGID